MTVDILRDRSVRARLGAEGSKVAFEKAKQFGRMHVPKSPDTLYRGGPFDGR
jgi:hypothetical protein